MFSRIPRYVPPTACLIVAVAAQLWVPRQNWIFDTQSHPDLQSIKVQTGYALVFENSPGDKIETILSYQADDSHNHQVTLSMEKAALAPQTLAVIGISAANAPSGKLLYAPPASQSPKHGKPCHPEITVDFLNQNSAIAHSVTFYPPRPDEYDPGRLRTVHLRSTEPLVVRASTNSEDGADGPNCRNTLTIGNWEQQIGKDVQVGFVAAPNTEITLQVAADINQGGFRKGNQEEEHLEIEPLHPVRLRVVQLGGARTEQIFNRANSSLTVTKLRLNSDSLQLNLSGSVGIPITNILGLWKWPLFAALDAPLLFWLVQSLKHRWRSVAPPPMPPPPGPPRRNIFLSYSWGDKDRVLQIYHVLEAAGADLWIDREELRGGDEWELRIKQQMRDSEQIVIFLSKSALEHKGYLWREIRMAADVAEEQPEGKAFIIPVKLDECNLPNVLGRWNCLDYNQPNGEQRLLQALGLRSNEKAASQS